MSLIIIMNGEKSQKYVDGKTRDTTPFIAAQINDLSATLGIGTRTPDSKNDLFWGLLLPHPIIQAWRGMKALEQLKEIRNETPCACWHIAKRNLNYDDDAYHLRLFSGFFKNHKVNSLRNKLLGMSPDTRELDQIISMTLKNNIPIDAWELQEELSAGYIGFTPTIQEALDTHS